MFKIKNSKNKIRVVVGMSGGVDSSVAVALLKKQGYDVIGVFLKFWQPPAALTNTNKCTNKHERENSCCNLESLVMARMVANKLKIPFYVLDASKEFKREVVDYYIEEYESGRTPNPCVMCNKFIKFGWFLDQAKKLGAYYIATGHYAKVESLLTTSQKDVHSFHGAQASGKRLRPTFCDSARSLLTISKDKIKDQTYFLWQLDQNQLSHVMFPIGKYTKSEVRELAKKFDLPSAEKKESQNVCFVPDGGNAEFLSNYAKKLTKPGDIVDIYNNVLGKHKGLAYYTIGQRHGLEGIQLKITNNKSCLPAGRSQITKKFQASNSQLLTSSIPPSYVLRLNIAKNDLVVGEEKDLYSKELVAEKVNWISSCNTKHVTCNKKFSCEAKIRYGCLAASCKLLAEGQNKIKVIFNKPQRAITPGQSIVFYNKNQLIGGGIISNE